MKNCESWLCSLIVLSFVVKYCYPIKCYGQRTGRPTSENFGRAIQCPKSISTCVTGIGSIGKPGRTKKFAILGRTCFSEKKTENFCKNETSSSCQRMVKSDGSILEFCYHCCYEDLCNTFVPTGIKLGNVKKPTRSPESSRKDNPKQRAIVIIRRKEKDFNEPSPRFNTTQQTTSNESKYPTQIPFATPYNSTQGTRNKHDITTKGTRIDIKDSSTIEKTGIPEWISKQNMSIHKLECRDNQMVVHLNARHISENFQINLQDPSCNYFGNYLNIVQNMLRFSIQYRSCGTIMKTTDTHTTYTNYIYIKPAIDKEMKKDKKNSYKLSVTCKHQRNRNTNIITGTPTPSRQSNAAYSISVMIYKKSLYKESYKPVDFPIRIRRSSWMFVEIKFESISKRIVLGEIDCYLKTHGGISMKIEVIQNTLPVNRSVRVTNTSATFLRFRLRVSSFMEKKERAYLTCTTHPVCNKEDLKCKQKKSIKEEVEYFTLSTGYFEATDDIGVGRSNEVTTAKDDRKKYITLGAALGVIFLMTVMCVVINKRNWSMKIIQESESDDTDSQPERSPLAAVEAVTDAEKPGYSGGIKS